MVLSDSKVTASEDLERADKVRSNSLANRRASSYQNWTPIVVPPGFRDECPRTKIRTSPSDQILNLSADHYASMDRYRAKGAPIKMIECLPNRIRGKGKKLHWVAEKKISTCSQALEKDRRACGPSRVPPPWNLRERTASRIVV